LPADFYTAAEVDDGAFGLELAAGQLEGLCDAHDFAHAIEEFEIAMIEIAVYATAPRTVWDSPVERCTLKPLAMRRSITCWISASEAPSCITITMVVPGSFRFAFVLRAKMPP